MILETAVGRLLRWLGRMHACIRAHDHVSLKGDNASHPIEPRLRTLTRPTVSSRMTMKTHSWPMFWAGLALLALSMPAQAEPYLAVRSGQSCSACHVNPTGGGKRTEYGTLYGYSALPAGRLENIFKSAAKSNAEQGTAAPGWDGRITDYLAVGADLRASFQSTQVPNTAGQRAPVRLNRVRSVVTLERNVVVCANASVHAA